jgi:hypothetical protein
VIKIFSCTRTDTPTDKQHSVQVWLVRPEKKESISQSGLYCLDDLQSFVGRVTSSAVLNTDFPFDSLSFL